MKELTDVEHLLVDLDGTLLGSRDFFLRLEFIARVVRGFRGHGSWWRSFRALHALRRELSVAPLEFLEDLTNDKRAGQILARIFRITPAQGESLLKETMPAIFPNLRRYFYPMAEAKPFLAWARDKLPMTLATDPIWSEELIRLRMEWAEIEPATFGMVTHAGIMHACKPSPEYYREVLQKIGVDPSRSLLIGNDMRMDLPATRVGIPVFIVSTVSRVTPVTRIPTPKGSAPAWKGSFASLKKMLEDALRVRAAAARPSQAK